MERWVDKDHFDSGFGFGFEFYFLLLLRVEHVLYCDGHILCH